MFVVSYEPITQFVMYAEHCRNHCPACRDTVLKIRILPTTTKKAGLLVVIGMVLTLF